MYVAVHRDPFDLRPERLSLRFNKREQQQLRRAADIADAARALWRASVDYDPDGDPMDVELGSIGVHVDEIIDGIQL